MPYGKELASEFPKIFDIKEKKWRYKINSTEMSTANCIENAENVTSMPYYIDIIDTDTIKEPTVETLGAESIGWR
jgi:hypothetical protein